MIMMKRHRRSDTDDEDRHEVKAMTQSSHWGLTPRQSIELEVKRSGREAVVRGCRALIRGEEADPQLVLALGGPGARKFLGELQPADDYWLRVWGLRGLLWTWADEAIPEIRLALGDPAWRAREMALKVVARHCVDDMLEDVLELKNDAVARVREQAIRCETVLAGHSPERP